MRKVFVLLLVLGVTSGAFSASVVQDLVKSTSARAANAPNSQDWFLAANWGGNANVGTPGIPQNDTATLCNGATMYGSAATAYTPISAVDAIEIRTGTAEVGQLRVGSNTATTAGVPAALAMYSGTLNVGNSSSGLHSSGFFSIGSDSATAGTNGRNGLFYMNGGTVNAMYGQGNIVVGNGNNNLLCTNYGKMFMSGGTVNALNLIISRYAGSTGELYLSGGTININTLAIRPNAPLPGSTQTQTAKLDITGSGKVVVTGDITTSVAIWSGNGWLTSGSENFLDVGTATFDGVKTTLMVPEPATLCLLGIGALSLIRRKR